MPSSFRCPRAATRWFAALSVDCARNRRPREPAIAGHGRRGEIYACRTTPGRSILLRAGCATMATGAAVTVRSDIDLAPVRQKAIAVSIICGASEHALARVIAVPPRRGVRTCCRAVVTVLPTRRGAPLDASARRRGARIRIARDARSNRAVAVGIALAHGIGRGRGA